MKQLVNIVMLIMFFVINFQVYGQSRILDGRYYEKNIHFEYLTINGEQFNFIRDWGRGIWREDTLAICNFKWVDKSLIEVNSIKDPSMEASKSMIIFQTKDSTINNDSIMVIFKIPTQEELVIHLSSDTSAFSFIRDYKYKLEYNQSKKVLFINKNSVKISFSIRPKDVIPSTLDGYFYSILEFLQPDVKINDNINKIIIEIPAINDEFFERYYIKGEYARVINDKIIWRGVTYKKR